MGRKPPPRQSPMPDKGQPGVGEAHETTRGGERVLIRPARPDDVALYPDFLADVGPEDLRLRFHARIAELSGAERDRLFRLDQRHEMAFVALDEDTGRMLGLVRLKDELDEQTARTTHNFTCRTHLAYRPRLPCLP